MLEIEENSYVPKLEGEIFLHSTCGTRKRKTFQNKRVRGRNLKETRKLNTHTRGGKTSRNIEGGDWYRGIRSECPNEARW